MPEPLSRFAPNASVIIGNAGDRPLARHPDLAVLALEALASWANVESFQLSLFVQMLGGNESVATSIYLALDGDGPKKAAIRAAADTAVGDSVVREILVAILDLAQTQGLLRNDLAHGTWGDSPDLPDALLLADPRKLMQGLDKSVVYVYRARDFTSMIESNDRLCGHSHLLTFILGGHVANRDGELTRRLLQEPDIADRLAIRRARRERATASKPPQSPPPEAV